MSNIISHNSSSLLLGNIIATDLTAILNKLNTAQNSIDAAQDKMNSFIAMKRSLAMTINELLDMQVDTTSLQTKLTSLDSSIKEAADNYITKKLEGENNIQKLKEQLAELSTPEEIESPIDYTKSEIINKPLSAESLKLDVQYFNFEMNMQSDIFVKVENFIKESTSDLGVETSNLTAKNASKQLHQQHQQHNISGTLIITASCTHKNISLIDPCILDPDKTVEAWNHINKENIIDTSDLSKLVDSKSSNNSEDSSIHIITGACYGSSFIGMIHILDSSDNNDNVDDDMIIKISNKMRLGGWLAESTGNLGVTKSVLDEVRTMLDTKKVNSHITLYTIGALPSIASNKIKLGIDSIMKRSLSKSYQNNASNTVDSMSSQAALEQKEIEQKNSKHHNVLSSLSNTDRETNKVLDINSLIGAFDNYLSSIKSNDVTGVPIKFHTKKISKNKAITLLLNKYNKNLKN